MVAGPRLPPAFTHLLADFAGVPAAQLTDRALVGGLLVAAAGAAGLSAVARAGTPGGDVPIVRALPSGGIAAALLLGSCHIIVHTRPEEGVLLLDVLAPRGGDPRKAADVFARRLVSSAVHTEEHARG